jgi:hypothetical protein
MVLAKRRGGIEENEWMMFGQWLIDDNSYNRMLAVAARTVRRSLKEDKRIIAERRGEMELRFAKWEVSTLLFHPFTASDRPFLHMA